MTLDEEFLADLRDAYDASSRAMRKAGPVLRIARDPRTPRAEAEVALQLVNQVEQAVAQFEQFAGPYMQLLQQAQQTGAPIATDNVGAPKKSWLELNNADQLLPATGPAG